MVINLSTELYIKVVQYNAWTWGANLCNLSGQTLESTIATTKKQCVDFLTEKAKQNWSLV